MNNLEMIEQARRKELVSLVKYSADEGFGPKEIDALMSKLNSLEIAFVQGYATAMSQAMEEE